MPAVDTLPQSQINVDQYYEDGYLIVPGLLSPEEVGAFLDHETQPHPAEWRNSLRSHTVNPARMGVATHPRILESVRQLLNGSPMIVQTMFLDKPAAGGKGIALHQDTYYIKNEPNTLMACWVALADTDRDNGGLCVVPGSHRGGLRGSHPNRNDQDHVVWTTEHVMRDPDGREWTHQLAAAEIDDVQPNALRYLEVPRGGGVFFTGLTIHGSFANQSSQRRRPAFATHYVREGTWVYRTDIQELVYAG